MLWERIQEYSATFAGDSGGTATQDNREEYPAFRRYKWDVKSTMTTSARFRPHNLKEKEVKRESRFDEIPPTYTPWSKHDVKDAANSPRPPCRELQLDDVTRNQSFFDNSTKVERPSALFDLDSAAQALSNMAKRKEERVEYQRRIDSILQIVKRKGKRTRKTKNTNSNARRPMNAFMLFAKRYRLEITQKHPGKDNRAISVILGDEWRSLSSEARKVYIMEAKTLAEEHKRIYPDCWKRKRTQMSSRGNRKH
ncbi:putative transcription factor capicua [Xenia sp. Carnegie-2017]|uniref:putative transcription factor capicua n=1 Tax=Xenia sp. Carnegie-2017 TaxID=2897299 RepID=UPI001F048E3A|nr:putative transcription factor capicua [Xenia sp. Carnegie-2017]